MSQETCEYDCELKDETDKAYLVVIDDTDYWIPMSVSTWNPSRNKIDGTIEIARWWAEREGLT